MSGSELATLMDTLGHQARAAAVILAGSSVDQRNQALCQAAAQLRSRAAAILAANQLDLAEATGSGLSEALLDRLVLDPARVAGMAAGLEAIARLPDPLGRVLEQRDRPNGLNIQRVSVPLGVIGIIHESRPNVTADAGALCLKSGNPVILRGGSECVRSSAAIHQCLQAGLRDAGLPLAAIQRVPTQAHEAVGYLLGQMVGLVDVIVPRGGRSLVERVRREARVPVIGHLQGNCHVYVDGAAQLEMARAVLMNSKLRRTGICGAAETLLVDRRCAASHLAPLLRELLDANCEVRGDEECQRADPRVRAASDSDWDTEYLAPIIAARVVNGVDGAVAHIARHGSAHTDCIVTADPVAAAQFLQQVDSAIVLHNASTQFADGGEFGMGAEIGISTDRFHARGPVGVEQLVSYKYLVRGTGQVRAP